MAYLIFGGDMFVMGFMIGARRLDLVARERRAIAAAARIPLEDELARWLTSRQVLGRLGRRDHGRVG